MEKLTHFNERGLPTMVEVGDKMETKRVAVAEAWLSMAPETLARIKGGGLKKGDVIGVAQVAGIMGAKRTADLIPMCHPLMLTGVDLSFDIDRERSRIRIEARVKTEGKTGVEMEALTAVSTAALTVYDMVKAIDRGMVIERIQLLEKEGGKSGHYRRDQHE
jgi:cyclic pyranopterin phosphate synthase